MNIINKIMKFSLMVDPKKQILILSKIFPARTFRHRISSRINHLHIVTDYVIPSGRFPSLQLVLPHDNKIPIGKTLIISYDDTQGLNINSIIRVEQSGNYYPLAYQTQNSEGVGGLDLSIYINGKPKGYNTYIWLGEEIGWEIHGLSILKTIGYGNSSSTPLTDEEGGSPNP